LLRARLARRGVTLSAGLLSAVAGDAAAGSLPHLVRLTLAALSRPSSAVAALAAAAATLAVPGPAKLALGVLLAAGLCVAFTTVGRGPVGPAALPVQARAVEGASAQAADDAIAYNGRVLGPAGK